MLEVNKLPDGQLLMSFPFMPLTLEDALSSNSLIDARSTVEQLFQGLDYIHREWGRLSLISNVTCTKIVFKHTAPCQTVSVSISQSTATNLTSSVY